MFSRVSAVLFVLLCNAAAKESCDGEKTHRAWRLRSRPVGEIADTDLELVTEAIPTIGENQMLVKNLFISLDPTHRIWMSDKAQYMDNVPLNDIMRAATVGVVEESNNSDFPVGMNVFGFGGVADYYLGIPGVTVLYKAGELGLPLSADLSVASLIIGLTAWHGVEKILEPTTGDVVVVSGGAGAVGSLVGQLAKARGATVIAIAGTPAKCAWITETVGLDHCINYKTEDVEAALLALAPEGVTHYFDNVGGKVTDAVLMNARNYLKMALCGSISEYDDAWSGQKNFNMILMRRISVTGFICTDHFGELQEATKDIASRVTAGKLVYLEDIRDGLESYIDSIRLLSNGGNTGKLMIKV